MKIMDCRETRPEDLAAFLQVLQVGETEIPAGVAVAVRVRRRCIRAEAGMPELDHAPGGE